MTNFLKDILRQPSELQRSLAYLTGPGKDTVESATSLLKSASQIFLTGIGSSWHAAMTATAILYDAGRPVYLIDSAELLHFSELPHGSVIIMLSRSGRSIEIVRLLFKARTSGAKVIALTNSADSPLAREADIPIVVQVDFDHGISVNTYSTLALAAGVLASHVVGQFDEEVKSKLSSALASTDEAVRLWRGEIDRSHWLTPEASYYFLARGSSLGTCHEARLLWEEGVKRPATAMGTGAFRHGPQEIATGQLHFGIWIDGEKMRDEDLAVARDLSRLGAHVMLVGQDLPETAAELVFQLPRIPAKWQFVIDAIPGQLAAERLSQLSQVDCDSFRICSYIVEDEGGLLRAEDAVGEHVG